MWLESRWTSTGSFWVRLQGKSISVQLSLTFVIICWTLHAKRSWGNLFSVSFRGIFPSVGIWEIHFQYEAFICKLLQTGVPKWAERTMAYSWVFNPASWDAETLTLISLIRFPWLLTNESNRSNSKLLSPLKVHNIFPHGILALDQVFEKATTLSLFLFLTIRVSKEPKTHSIVQSPQFKI